MGPCCIAQGAQLSVCDDLEGWDGGMGGGSTGRGYMCMYS